MNLKEIKELIKIIDNSTLTELNYECDNVKLVLKKEIRLNYVDTYEIPQTKIQSVSKESAVEIDKTDIKVVEEDLHIIKSPIVGIYYASSNPDAQSLVKPGDKVKIGQVLCIVEAMKLMNEITSDVDGEIVEVLSSNQSPVEFGQPLFKIRKA